MTGGTYGRWLNYEQKKMKFQKNSILPVSAKPKKNPQKTVIYLHYLVRHACIKLQVLKINKLWSPVQVYSLLYNKKKTTNLCKNITNHGTSIFSSPLTHPLQNEAKKTFSLLMCQENKYWKQSWFAWLWCSQCCGIPRQSQYSC